MNKIIGIIKPFDMNQTIYIHKEGQNIQVVQTTIEKIAKTIFKLTEQNNINQVDILGPQAYTKGIVKKIQNQELTKYNKNNLKFTYI